MARFILLLAMIAQLNGIYGISITQKSLAPELLITPSSNSIQVAWVKLSSWSSSSMFVVSISTPNFLITNDVLCEGGPGITCVFNSEAFNVMLPACTPTVVTVEASGLLLGPHITTTLSPDPLHISVEAKDKSLYVNWELPAACEKSSKLIIRARGVIVHEKVLSVPQSSYTYELIEDISYSDVFEVLVKTVDTSERESRGIKNTFVYADVFEPRAVSISLIAYETSVDVIFIRGYPWNSVTNFTLTIHKGTDNGGDELCSKQPFTCDVFACNINSADYCDPLPDCEFVFVEVNGIGSETASSTIKTLCGTDPTTTAGPSTDTSSTPEISVTSTTITSPTTASTTTITPISSTPTTTETSTLTPEYSTSETTEPTTASPESTTPAITKPTTMTPVTTTPTTTSPSTTEPTTTTLETTTTILPTSTTTEPSDPSVAVSTTSDAVYVTWYRNGPWSDVDTFTITITDANDIQTELCSAEVECDEPQCTFESEFPVCPEYVFTSCSEVSVTVTGGESSQPAVSAQIAPQSPSEMSLNLTGTVVDLQWILPDSCETGSRVSINVAGDRVDEDIPKTTSTYSYTYSGNLDCDVGQATVTSMGKDGESEGITEEFLLTETTSLWAHIDSESTIQVTWSKPSCVKRTTVAWYDESEDNLIGSKEVNNKYSYEITDIGDYEVVLVCVTPKARGTVSTWVDGETQCTIASDTTPAPPTTTSTTSKTTTTTIPVTTTTDAVTTDTSEGTETEHGTTESNVTDPPDNTALIVGLSVGIPVALLAIAGIVYIIKKKTNGDAVTLEMTSQK